MQEIELWEMNANALVANPSQLHAQNAAWLSLDTLMGQKFKMATLIEAVYTSNSRQKLHSPKRVESRRFIAFLHPEGFLCQLSDIISQNAST